MNDTETLGCIMVEHVVPALFCRQTIYAALGSVTSGTD